MEIEMEMENNTQYTIPSLPLRSDIETKAILKKASDAVEALARLDEASNKIPKEDILINTLLLQESKFSSEVENIITTNEEVYEDSLIRSSLASENTKEVRHYREALHKGWLLVKETQSNQSPNPEMILTNKTIKQLHAILINNDAGFRTQEGIQIVNSKTGETVYKPPSPRDIEGHMANLEKFINENELCDWNPLVKMAVIHHQFESIHPFYDGNGRIGRVINILYLVQQKKIRLPILYLSRYINSTKDNYYFLLKEIQKYDTTSKEYLDAWEKWIIYILEGIQEISEQTLTLINDISHLMDDCRRLISENEQSKNYEMPLTHAIFMYTHTDIKQVKNIINRSRKVATQQLDNLCSMGILFKTKPELDKRRVIYINIKLFLLLHDVGEYYEKPN